MNYAPLSAGTLPRVWIKWHCFKIVSRSVDQGERIKFLKVVTVLQKRPSLTSNFVPVASNVCYSVQNSYSHQTR